MNSVSKYSDANALVSPSKHKFGLPGHVRTPEDSLAVLQLESKNMFFLSPYRVSRLYEIKDNAHLPRHRSRA